MAYRRRGTGEPLVFVHGGAVNADIWRDVVPVLAGRYDCITPDLPLGSHTVPIRRPEYLSPPGIARLLGDILDALGLERATFITNDAGGAIGQILATTQPGRISRLVLTSCDAFDNHPPGPLRYLHALRDVPGVVPAWFWLAAKSRLARWAFYRSVARRPIEPAVLASYTVGADDALVRGELVAFFRGMRPEQTLEAARKLVEFTAPTLVAWGADDVWFPASHGQALANLIPGARFVSIPGARTFVPEDQPVLLAETVAEFLAANPLAA